MRKIYIYQAWFILENESIWDQLRNIQSVGTLYKKLSDVNLSKQP